MMGNPAMTKEILQAVTIVIWALSALLAIMGLRELVRLHGSAAGKLARQRNSAAKTPVTPLAHKPMVKLSPGIGSHSDQQISKLDRCPHREVKFEKRRREGRPVSRPIRDVHNVPATPMYWLTKKYEDSYIMP
jgi:hypothetical protein